jgi:DNA-binding protein HU-beta
MNKADLISAVMEKTEVSKADATKSVDAIFDAITDALKQGDQVSVPGFGIFQRKERAARQGRNPQTGESIQIPAAKVPSFKAGKGLKEAVNV